MNVSVRDLLCLSGCVPLCGVVSCCVFVCCGLFFDILFVGRFEHSCPNLSLSCALNADDVMTCVV